MMKPYPSYKDSGVEWIGEIPGNWELKRLKYLCTVTTGDKDTKDRINDGLYPFFVRSPIIERINSYSFDGESVLTAGDGVGTGKVFHHINGKFDFHQRVYKFSHFNDIDGKYFYWFIKTNFINVTKDQNSKSTVDSLRLPLIQNFQFVLPSLKQQNQIVSYLDKQTQKIDDLIDNSEKKIELLKEKRTALINHCVTKGLNPDVEMKDSGVERIGEIPDGWQISRLDYLCDLHGRIGWKSLKSDEYVEDGYVFLSTPNIKNNEIDYNNVNYITEERYLESPEIILKENDVLLVKDGSTLGIVNIVRELPRPSTVNSSIGVIRNKSDSLYECFLYYLLSSYFCQSIINRIRGGMGVPHLFQSDIKKFIVLLPKKDEQRQIVDYLDEHTQKIDSTIEIETKRIELLKEYRQSLISNVVTGKIDVRDEVVI